MNPFLRDFLVDKAQATEIINRFLHDLWHRQNHPDPQNPLMIREEATLEKDWGWVFFCNCKRAIATQDLLESVIGLGPLVIDKVDGSLHELNHALPLHTTLAEYERRRKLLHEGPKMYELEEHS